MTTTTFKSVGGTSKTAEKAAAKPAATPKATPKVAAKKPAAPKGKPGTIIPGEGTMPVYADGAMRRVPRGEPVELSAGERAYLKRANINLA